MVAYIVIFVLLLLAELLYFRIADKCNIIDKPNERSSHKQVILRGGGIIFLIGVWIWSAFFGFQYPWFLIGVTLVALVSFIDDIRSLPDSVRLVVQCFAGDVGSLSIAFIIVFALGKLILQTGDFTYLVFLALYGVDSVLTICHRILLHENLGKAHRKHAYQLMANELRIPHVVVSSFYMMLQLLVSFGMVLLPMNHWLYLVTILVVLCGSYLLFMKRYYHLHESYLRSLNN